MTTQTPVQAITKTEPSPVATFATLLRARKEAIAQVMPKSITPERLLKVALNCYEKTPALQKCTASSLIQCVTSCAELGLEPGGALGGAYLVPYGQVCTLVIGYRGLVELAHRSGKVLDVRAVVVHEKDEWQYSEGLEQRIHHVPSEDADPGPMVRVYCVVTLVGGLKHADVMSRAQVDAIRQRSKASGSGPWVTDYEEMAKKTVVRRAMKLTPLSPEQRDAIDRDEETVDGEVVGVEASALPPPPRERVLSRRVKIEDVSVAQSEAKPIVSALSGPA